MSAIAMRRTSPVERHTRRDPEALSINGLVKTYRTKSGQDIHALGPLDLDIAAGEFVSIVGPSGCGKSTLLKIVAGLEDATGGQVRIGQSPVTGADERMGIVFQRATLLPWRTIRQNVLLPLQVRRRTTRELVDRIEYLVDLVGLAAFRDRYPDELSGGMQQRAAIARALVHDPNVLLMDEPFGALDEFTREALNTELLRMWQQQPKTVLFITHSIAEAVYMSDRVVVLSGRPGEIVDDVRIPLDRPRMPEMRSLEAMYECTRRIRVALDAANAGAATTS